MRLYDLDVEIHARSTDSETGVYRGLGGCPRSSGATGRRLDEFGSEVEECIDAGDDVIVGHAHLGRGRRAAASQVEARQSHVFDGSRTARSSRLRVFGDHAEALKAVGLEE